MLESLTIAQGSATLASGFMLVSVWKPILLFAPFVAWAWFVSSVLDKHAQRFFLGQEKWALIHMLFGLAALAAIIFVPIGGFAGFGATLLIVIALLAGDIGLFVAITNRDERVPEGARLTLDFEGMKAARDEKAKVKQLGTSELIIVGAKKMKVPPPPKESPEFAVRIAAEQIIDKAFGMHASQVDILPANESTYAASYLVDGVRQPGDPVARNDAVQIIDFWKSCAGLDVQDRRRKLQGEVSISGEGMSSTTVSLITSGSGSGMRLSMIFNPAEAVRRKPADLGMLDKQFELVQSWAGEPGGVVLLAGPSDAGRTTTFYTVLKLHDAYTANISTIELDIEDAIEGIKQIRFDPSADGPDFATTVRSNLRRDPDVLGIAELPDTETAANIARADLERSRVYLSLKANSALEAVQLYAKAVGDPKLAADGLKGVIAHRLVRALCSNCKVAYSPTPDMLKKLGLPPDKVPQLFKKGGQVLVRNKPEVCPVCNGVGYMGQTGVFGVFPIEDEEKALIAEQNWSGLRSAMRKRQLPTVQQSALRKAVEGMTSIEEVTRVTAEPKKPAPSKSKSAEPAA
ncbi:MAG: Flp pilus assembly complex ATPase component TadA [Phycisphaerales bacterium]|nr:Flp pilus assembly complex ATPase component TadA [Planctomycetota bacterium]MCH8507490.1 Flp pilus assembly complex ATPase component TadA [Phycisphaerales bacterium]